MLLCIVLDNKKSFITHLLWKTPKCDDSFAAKKVLENCFDG
jgi:hypothetical protein